ncbi:DUF2917 domain-containing protein [Xylophilus sp.]|uniref:DUF2917 domain-containing protein n=1 Tax=Xylophilus sp. TaxID=2653893 RepID=UPI0013BE0F93|nr:DUF2917 domain-containing protein [Xylophilus sp.]KAF1046435.1 MAG: hypothetical protein GAK38_02502 [Xylophilus sp.]
MTAVPIPDPQQCRLQPGQAATLRAIAASRLTVIEGRAWITFDGPHGLGPQAGGDLVLTAGSPGLDITARQRVVMEPYDAAPVLVRIAVVPARARAGLLRLPRRRARAAAPAAACAPPIVSCET